MERNNPKTSLGFMLSVLLHGGAIAIIALGPAYMPGLIGDGNKDSEFIEFSIPENSSSLSDITPVVVPPTPVQKEEPAPEVVQKPVEKPVVVEKKAVPVKEQKLPEKIAETEEAPEITPIPVAESEVVTEEVPEETPDKVSDEKFADLKEPVEEEEMLPAPTPVAQTEPEVVAEPEPEVASPPQLEPTTTAAATSPEAGESAEGIGETAASGATGTKQTIEVTQAYMGLRQMPGNVPPKYGTELRRKRIQGRGQLVYYVTRDGQVTNIKLTKSTGSQELDQSAIAAFSKYKFYPGQEGYTVHDFEFSLQGPAIPEGGKLRTSFKK